MSTPRVCTPISLDKRSLSVPLIRSASNFKQPRLPTSAYIVSKDLPNKFELETDHTQKELLNSKSKLSSALEMLSMLDTGGQKQRCLEHNNTMTLYCLNERRILCVNCLYGMSRHRSHKVFPLKDRMKDVLDDNEKLSTYISS
jgi:hypothetical protein